LLFKSDFIVDQENEWFGVQHLRYGISRKNFNIITDSPLGDATQTEASNGYKNGEQA
jgi:hypothetical protein